jgi:HK97 family phage major capsid protein
VAATETIPDAIARSINATENRFYTPTAVMIHNNNFWDLQQLKDSLGRYILNPQVVGPVAMSIWGIPFVKTTQIPSGSAIIGDWKNAYLYLGDNLLIDSSSEAGTRFDTNITGYRIEEEMGFNAGQNINAFTRVNF